MNTLIVFIAQYLIIASVLGVVGYGFSLAREQKLNFAIHTIAGGIISLAFIKLGALLYNDPRPFISDNITPLIHHAADNGFPSDHTALTAFLGFLVLMYSRKLGIALLIIALLVGSARVAAGIHHPIDIVGAFIIGAIGAYLGSLVRRRRQPAA